jgi:succinate dehydrogenase / fumarate reductase iron-sulfur subunit
MNLKLKVWRQARGEKKGRLVAYSLEGVSPEMSFLEMLDMLNRKLTLEGEEPVAFDNDCREGICGTCSLVINGQAHGAEKGTTVCQLHMRHFRDGQTLVIEPWRARAFPVIKDLIVDRSAFDKITAAGGYISVGSGAAPDANAIPVGKVEADASFDAAACIGCGACVAACPNASAMLYVSAKISQFSWLPQGQPERYRRAVKMVAAMDEAMFGACTNIGECEAACPKEISVVNITRMNRDFLKASFLHESQPA